MNLSVSGKLAGTVTVPPSKSMAHRLLICAALADGPTRFLCGECPDDVNITADCLRDLGASIKYSENEFRVWPIGNIGKLSVLDCGESGTTLRFLLPVAAALGADATFTGSGRLFQRPLSPLLEQMRAHGVDTTVQDDTGLVCRGRMEGGCYSIAADISSQFISGLLFALPLAGSDSTIKLEGELHSSPYVDMTLNALRHSGIDVERTKDGYCIKGNQRYGAFGRCAVEGDWSAAAFWLTAGAIGQEPVRCEGLDTERTLQGDKAIVHILQDMGAEIRAGNGYVTAYPSRLQGIEIDCSDIPDLVPALAAAAACADGKTTFHNAGRLRLKESDRIESIQSMLRSFGISAVSAGNVLTVTGGHPSSCNIDPSRDHRIAMAATILSSVCEGCCTIQDAGCVAKSYPAFFNDYRSLGGHIE